MNDRPITAIDTTSAQTWADTWIKKFRDLIPLSTNEFDLRSDMFAGELPWAPDLGQQVDEEIMKHPDLSALLSEFEEKFGVRYLRQAFYGMEA